MIDHKESKRFQWGVLSFLGVSLWVLIALQLISPSNSITQAPKQISALGILKDGNSDALQAEREDLLNRLSVKDLNIAFDKLNYKLSEVLDGDNEVPRLFLTSLPHDLDRIKQTEERKSIFFRALLPLALKINEEILQERKTVLRLRHRLSINLDINPQDRIWLDGAFQRYKVKYGQFDTLLTRMDVIPPSLTLAQAAEESGWGTSRFVQEGNALFGQWTFDPAADGIVPNGRDEDEKHRIKAFDSLKESLKAYARNLNTHQAYRDLRVKRAHMRKKHIALDGYSLAQTLDQYSERGEQYVTSLHAIMDHNDLRRFDDAALKTGERIALGHKI